MLPNFPEVIIPLNFQDGNVNGDDSGNDNGNTCLLILNDMSPHFSHVVVNLDVSNALLININVAQVPNMADLVMIVTI